MTMELTQLRYFVEVKSRGSITAAARALGVSQPSLTVAIQRLEKELGTTLLLRGRGGVTLTVTGRALAYDAEEVFAVLDRVEHRINGLEEDEVGRFVIGCHESLGAYFLPPFMRDFLAAAPHIEPALFNGSSAMVRDAVVARDVDFGIVVNPSPHPDLVLVDLFGDAVDFFVAAPAKRNAKSGARSLREAEERVQRGPLIHAGRVSESQELLRALESKGVVPDRLLSCGDFELVKALTVAGVGVGVLPRRVALYGQDGHIVRLHPEMPHVEDKIFMVYRADMHKTRAALRLKQALVDHGRSLRSEKKGSARLVASGP